jgi:predicted ATP-dependent protease
MTIEELAPEQLRKRIDPKSLGFDSTKDIRPLEDIIGQERAQESIKIALGIDAPGYNVYAAGYSGSGKATAIRKMVEDASRETEFQLHDIAYVYNFQKNDEPMLLEFVAGEGRRFKDDIGHAIRNVKSYLNDEFNGEEFSTRISGVRSKYVPRLNTLSAEGNSIKEKTENAVREQYEKNGGNISISPSALKNIPRLKDIHEEIQDLESKMNEESGNLKDEFAQRVVDKAFTDLTEQYEDYKIRQYIESIKQDILSNIDNFIGNDDEDEPKMVMTSRGPMPMPNDQKDDTKYEVNLVVDNSGKITRPVVVETDPRFVRLFGTIERRWTPMMGATTDHTKIVPGSFHEAKGGYLVLDFMSAYKQPFVLEKLISSLKSGEVTIQSTPLPWLNDESGLKPEPIGTEDVKVILTGSPIIYHMLYQYDPDFREIFRIKADFEHEISLDDKVIADYAGFITKLRKDEDLQHFDASGITAVIEYAMREADSQKKVSLIFQDVAAIAREADYWAKQDKGNGDLIKEKHIDKAIESKRYRSGMIDEKITEMIQEGMIMIDTTEEVVGQVNALAVMNLGDYSFGKPSKITAKTYVGTKGVTHIEREIEKSGAIHNKGVFTLTGYLGSVFAQDKPLSFNASITFEQQYGGIDGDSASSTELYALLSSLSGVAIKQGIAVTGSVNQNGEVQPIGGVNEKVEGYFDICRQTEEGLTGEQGVMIPYQNVQNLMLRKDVVEAVEQGKFHIYPVRKIEEGIEILTGMPAGTIDQEGTVYHRANERIKDINLQIKGERREGYLNRAKDAVFSLF